MDLMCEIKSNWGKTQWAAGYQLQIGLDGIARNVPDEAAAKLLSNAAVWRPVRGGSPPPTARGLLRSLATIAGGLQHGVPEPTPPEPTVVEVERPLVPISLGFLEAQSRETLLRIAAAFDLDLSVPHGASTLGETAPIPELAREILKVADVELEAQLRVFAAEPADLPVEPTDGTASAEAASIVVPSPPDALPLPEADPGTLSDPRKGPRTATAGKAPKGPRGGATKEAPASPPPEATNDDLLS